MAHSCTNCLWHRVWSAERRQRHIAYELPKRLTSAVPGGTRHRLWDSLPSDESLGYFRMSLRDTGPRQITELYDATPILPTVGISSEHLAQPNRHGSSFLQPDSRVDMNLELNRTPTPW